MEIVTSLPTGAAGASGGSKKHVEEWSRLDRLTGMLEHARVEADHWASNTSNSRHHFGQVVDSRARNLADGSVQQKQQTKKLEVFQAHIPGGSVQVIRSHTSTTSSWHNSKVQNKSHIDWPSSIGDKLLHRMNKMDASMNDLKLHHNLVNLNSEKTKASVARLLPTRRPPTRSRFLKTNKDETAQDDFFANIPQMCQYAHSETEKRLDAIAKELKFSLADEASGDFQNRHILNGAAAATATETLNEHYSDTRQHKKVEKKKSISDENLSAITDEKEKCNPWKRTSKTRWSFQYPRTKYKEERTSKGTAEFESPKCELEAVLAKVLRRKGQHLDKYAKSVTQEEEGDEKNNARKEQVAWKASSAALPKRRSFVTEETLKQTKQRLRHLNGSTSCGSGNGGTFGDDGICVKNNSEETDDGICTGSKGNSDKEDEKEEQLSFGSVADPLQKQDERATTSSLESRAKNKSDDWLDRRKSYGFEPVHGQQRNMVRKGGCSPKITNLSTDSGICRSSELELVSTPIVKKLTEANEERVLNTDADDEIDKHHQREPSSVSSKSGADVAQLLKKFEKKCDSQATVRTVKTAATTVPTATVVTLTNDQSKITMLDANARKSKVMEAIKSLRESSINATAFEPSSSMMKSNLRLPSDGDSDAHLPTYHSRRTFLDDDILSKRHSIACEDAKYMISKFSALERVFQEKLSNLAQLSQPTPPSLSSPEPVNTTVVNVNNFQGGDDAEILSNDGLPSPSNSRSPSPSPSPSSFVDVAKKPKKVEFSKTEVHFAAAEPGKIKIVETDEKPPPANLYRKKKRSVSLSPKIGLNRNKFAYGGKGTNDNAQEKLDDMLDSHGAVTVNEVGVVVGGDTPRHQFTSSTSDNGLAVRISSTRPNDFRRASWSVLVDPNENKPGYSTKINFGREGVTIVADAKTQNYEKPRNTVDSVYDSKSSSLGEISEKSHFMPLRSEEEKLKTGHGNEKVDITRPKITSVAVNVQNTAVVGDSHVDSCNNDDDDDDEKKILKKCTTVLLNNEKVNRDEESESTKCAAEQHPTTSAAVQLTEEKDENEDATAAADVSTKVNNNNQCSKDDATLKIGTRAKANTKFAEDYKAVRVIPHCVRLPPEKELLVDRHLVAESRRKDAEPKIRSTTAVAPVSAATSMTARKMPSSRDSMIVITGRPNGGVSVAARSRKSNHHVHRMVDTGRLFDTGRDGWLNLPKERKHAGGEHTVTKVKPTSWYNSRKSTTVHVDDKEEKYRVAATAAAAAAAGGSKLTSRHSSKMPATSDVISTTTTTYTDASSEDDVGRKRITHRKQWLAKPLTTISEKSSLKVDVKRGPKGPTTSSSRTIANVSDSICAKAPVTRTTSNSSLESRSNSYEFKNPILKTEERSKRRAARMLQRATSREALMKAQSANISSSEDITSENEVSCLRTSKLKTTRKTKSPKLLKLSQPANAMLRSKCNRMIQQKTAKMEINIFRIREKPKDKNVYNFSNSGFYPANNSTVTKTQSRRGQKEINTKAIQKSRCCRSATNTSNNNMKSKHNSTDIGNSTR